MNQHTRKPDWVGIFKKYFTGGKRNFSSTIGVNTTVLDYIWLKYLKNSKFNAINLLWLYSFLRNNNSLNTHAGNWKTDYKKWCKCIYELIDFLYEKMNTIQWKNRFLDQEFIQTKGTFENITFFTDGFPAKIEKKGIVGDECYSGKYKFHCLRYLLCISVYHGYICYISEPFIGKRHDSRIFKRCKIMNKMLLGEKGGGDKAFKAFIRHLTTKYNFQKEWEILLFGCARQQVERIIGRINHFAIVKKRAYRGDIQKHHKIIKVICKTVNIDLLKNKAESNRFISFSKKDFFNYLINEKSWFS